MKIEEIEEIDEEVKKVVEEEVKKTDEEVKKTDEEVKKVEDVVEKEAKTDADSKLDPNHENGYDFSNYRWTQNAKDVTIFIPISDDIKSRDIKVDFATNRLCVSIKGEIFFNGSTMELTNLIKPDDCTWFIDSDDKRMLIIELDKKKFDEWWVCIMKGDQEIDASKIRPPNAQISDLDSSTRATIDKMMYDEKIKQENGFYKDRV